MCFARARNGMRKGLIVRLEQLEREVRELLERVCERLPRHEFDRLVRRIAMAKLRFELPPESFAEAERAAADGEGPAEPEQR